MKGELEDEDKDKDQNDDEDEDEDEDTVRHATEAIVSHAKGSGDFQKVPQRVVVVMAACHGSRVIPEKNRDRPELALPRQP